MGIFDKSPKEEKQLTKEQKESREDIIHDFTNIVYDLKTYLVKECGMSLEEATKELKKSFEYTNTRARQGDPKDTIMPKRMPYNTGFANQ